MTRSSCPSPDRILRYVGSDADVPDLDPHLAACPRCARDLDIGLAVSHWAAAEAPVEIGAPSRSGLASRIRRLRHQARLALEGRPASWWQHVVGSPDRRDPSFLFEVADRAVWRADEEPTGVLRLVPILRGMVEQLQAESPLDLGAPTLARLALAEGVARRTQGDHLGAVASYARGEAVLDERATSHEHARLQLARAASLRWLRRLDEAEHALRISRQTFARTSDEVGEAKATWELANVVQQRGRSREAWPLIVDAYRGLTRLGEPGQAAVALLAAAGILITLRRPTMAERLLSAAERDDAISTCPSQRARAAWLRGRAAAARGDLADGCRLLRQAALAMEQAGDAWSVAGVELEMAHVAGGLGDLALQAEAAGRAVAILSALPGHDAELALALGELRLALAGGAAVLDGVAKLRRLQLH